MTDRRIPSSFLRFFQDKGPLPRPSSDAAPIYIEIPVDKNRSKEGETSSVIHRLTPAVRNRNDLLLPLPLTWAQHKALELLLKLTRQGQTTAELVPSIAALETPSAHLPPMTMFSLENFEESISAFPEVIQC
jgi:hypothetical protein